MNEPDCRHHGIVSVITDRMDIVVIKRHPERTDEVTILRCHDCITVDGQRLTEGCWLEDKDGVFHLDDDLSMIEVRDDHLKVVSSTRQSH